MEPRETHSSSIQAPREPHLMNEIFVKAYNSGDVSNINLLFEKDAVVVRPNGSVIQGVDAYTQEHQNLVKIGGVMTSINKSCIIHNDIALLNAEWEIKTKNEQGEPITISSVSTEIVRKQSDGSWLYIVDNPFSAWVAPSQK
jgi:Ketosteroid isomerase homolog